MTLLGNTARNIRFVHILVSFIYINSSDIFGSPEDIAIVFITKATKYFG